MALAVRGLFTFSICLALVAALPVTGAAQFTPTPGSPFDAGSFPGFTVGDFNGDGRSDLAGVTSDNTVSVLLGSDNGAFVPAAGQRFAVEAGSSIEAVADFDRDGRSDLVILHAPDNHLTILLSSGAGGFRVAPGSPFAIEALYPGVATVGDFNGDGRADLAIANNTSSNIYTVPSVGTNSVIVLLGNGEGRFRVAPGSPFGAGTMSVYSLAAGDFNHDGVQDLVVGYFGDAYYQLLVLLGSRSGRLTPVGSYPVQLSGTFGGASSIVVADFNGDGKSDVVLTEPSFSHGSVEVRLGDGAGGFTRSWTSGFTGYPRTVAVADFNGDGIPDLALSIYTPNVAVYFGDGTGQQFGGPQPPNGPLSAPNYSYSLGFNPGISNDFVVGDFNGDGKPDIILTDGQRVAVLLNSLPAITVTPNSVEFRTNSQQPTEARVEVDSAIAGSTYTATSNQSWLSVNPTSNATGAPGSVTISVERGTLAPGTYSGVVRYVAPNFFGAKTDVTFRIQ